jgi:hypothetical protein
MQTQVTTIPGRSNAEVLAFYQTETIDGIPAGIILVKWRGEFVTARYKLGDPEWAFGNYFGDEEEAREDYRDRINQRHAFLTNRR